MVHILTFLTSSKKTATQTTLSIHTFPLSAFRKAARMATKVFPCRKKKHLHHQTKICLKHKDLLWQDFSVGHFWEGMPLVDFFVSIVDPQREIIFQVVVDSDSDVTYPTKMEVLHIFPATFKSRSLIVPLEGYP